jgi:hypothetical protein
LPFGASEFVLGKVQPRFGLVQFSLGASEFGLVGPWIDNKEQIPLFDFGAIFEVNGLQIAADAGADFDHFDCFQMAGVLVPFDDIALKGAVGGHGRWWTRSGRPALVASRCQEGDDDRGERARVEGCFHKVEKGGHVPTTAIASPGKDLAGAGFKKRAR